MTATVIDPESRTAASWSASLANLVGRGTPDDDHRIVECRQELSFHRVARAIRRERGQLSKAGADRLRTMLDEAVRR